MTETTNGAATETSKHNVGARAATIRSGFNKLFDLEAEIDKAIATHVKPLKDMRTKGWRDLKKDTDITRRVLELEYRQYKMFRDAQDDEETGDKTQDDMREVFEALHPGGQLDWIAAVEETMPAQRSLN